MECDMGHVFDGKKTDMGHGTSVNGSEESLFEVYLETLTVIEGYININANTCKLQKPTPSNVNVKCDRMRSFYH